MGLVSTHQLSTFTTPVNGTSPIDANQVKGNDNSIKTSYNAHDADTTIHLQSGAVATRPAASTAGQTWLATDSGAVYLWLDNGSAWVEANYLRNTGGTVTGNVLITGTLGVTGATTLSSTLTIGGVTYTFPASQGANQYLKTDGSGNLSWTTFLETIALTDLSDVTITSVASGQFLYYNGTVWVNGTNGSALTTLNASNLSSGTVNTARVAGSYTGITAVGTLTAGAISTGFTAIADTFLATISTASKVSNSATTATNANTASAIVARDASGNFTAGTVTAALTGNATTATTLATARAINGVNFDGSAAITVTAAAGTLTGTTLASNVVTSSLTSVGTIVTGVWQGTPIANSSLANSLITINLQTVSLGGSVTVTAAAGTLSGTTLASNVTLSSLTSVGTLSAGAVPASLVTAGTFGAGAYTFPGALAITGAFTGATTGAFSSTVTCGADINQTASAYVYSSAGGSGVRAGLFNDGTNQKAKLLAGGTVRLEANTGGVDITGAATVSSTLAITGALTGVTTLAASGLVTLTGGAVYINSTNSDSAMTGSYIRFGTNLGIQSNAANSVMVFKTFNGASFIDALSLATSGAATFASSLAITGAFTGATNITASAGVNSVAPATTKQYAFSAGVTGVASTAIGFNDTAGTVDGILTKTGFIQQQQNYPLAIAMAAATIATFATTGVTLTTPLAITGAFTGATTITGSDVLTLNHSSTPYFRSQISGVNKAYFGAAGAGTLMTGSASGDLVVRAESGTLWITNDGGTTAGIKIGASNAVTMPGTLAVTGNVTMGASGAANSILTLNAASATGYATLLFQSASVGKWYLGRGVSDLSDNFQITTGAVAIALSINNSTRAVAMPAYGAGAATFDASGNITSTSDMRHKVLQGTFGVGLSELRTIDPILYKWNEASGNEMEHTYAGFSAQNLKAASEYFCGVRTDGILSMQDRAILAACVNAIKELDARASTITALTARVAALEAH